MTVPSTTEQHLTALRGQAWIRSCSLPLSQGDLSGVDEITMTVKREADIDKPGDAHALAKINNKALGGVSIESATHALFTIPEAVMRRMPRGTHRFDVRARLASGVRETPLTGTFTVDGDVGRD